MAAPPTAAAMPQLVDVLVFGLMDVDENVRLEAVEAIATAATTRLSLLGEDQHVCLQPPLMPHPPPLARVCNLFFLSICSMYPVNTLNVFSQPMHQHVDST